MKVTMRAQISGTRNGEDWPAPGGVIDLPDDEAERLIAQKLAVPGDQDVAGIAGPPGALGIVDGPATDKVSDIKDWVGDDPGRAATALTAEMAKDPEDRRGSLVTHLEKLAPPAIDV